MRVQRSNKKAVSPVIITMIAAALLNTVLATLLVLSGSEIIQFVSSLTGADVGLSPDLLKASGVLLWIAAFLFLCFFEAVLGFIGWIFWSVITGS